MVQETFEHAWRGMARFRGDSSPRAWLYKIATNACLDALRKRRRRRIPFDVMDPVGPAGEMADAGDHLWLEPFPDGLLADQAGESDPGEAAVHRETIELVFLAAIQHLPPWQRAVFISRDVMGWTAKATAVLLDTSEAAVKSALQRARAAIRERIPNRRDQWAAVTGVSEAEQAVLKRYIGAHQADSSEALAEVLAEDVRIAYPQIPLWSDSHEAFITATKSSRLRRVPVRGHERQSAACRCHIPRPPGEPVYRLTALELLRIEGDRVVEIVDFDPSGLDPAFDLEPTLP